MEHPSSSTSFLLHWLSGELGPGDPSNSRAGAESPLARPVRKGTSRLPAVPAPRSGWHKTRGAVGGVAEPRARSGPTSSRSCSCHRPPPPAELLLPARPRPSLRGRRPPPRVSCCWRRPREKVAVEAVDGEKAPRNRRRGGCCPPPAPGVSPAPPPPPPPPSASLPPSLPAATYLPQQPGQ